MSYMRAGTILIIDLTTGRISKEPTSSYARQWIGGRGLNARILYERVGPQVKPLDPQNVLIFSVGPFTGTMVPGSGRTEVAAKSPVIDIQGMSSMGGYWGPELKYAGYDCLVVEGRAAGPVYVAIDNQDVQIRDAAELWGLDTYQTPAAIRKELSDPEVEVACIGPGGENGVVYATIQTRVGNAAGRTGMGAVMGAKNLKAIAVRGTGGVDIAKPEQFLDLCTRAFDEQKSSLDVTDTAPLVENNPPDWAVVLGNYEATVWDHQKDLAGGHEPFWQTHKNRVGDGKMGCFNCQIRCKDHYDMPGLGPLMANCNFYMGTTWVLKDPDFQSWYRLALKCTRYGIDVSSVSRMIAWAMELYQQGRITAADTDGIALDWGAGDAIGRMLDKIALRQGFGDILASTPREARNRIGGDVSEALNVKGAPMGGTNAISWRSRAIGAAVNPRGGDEFRTRYASFDYLGGKEGGMTGMSSLDSWEGRTALKTVKAALAGEGHPSESVAVGQFDYTARGALAALAHELTTVSDMLGQCRWNTIMINQKLGIEFQAAAMSLGEGREMDIETLMKAASRVAAQERGFAVREGRDRSHDTLPKRLFDTPLAGTWPQDRLEPEAFEKMKDEYYAAMGWDSESGIPTTETLKALDLADVAADLKR